MHCGKVGLYVYIAYLVSVLICQENDEPKPETFCRERNRPIATEHSDLFELTEVQLNEHVILQCHYCKETDNEEAKVWFKTTKFMSFTHSELQLDMHNDHNISRVYASLDHSLHIQNVTLNDSGYYFCHNAEWKDSEREFNFYIDVIEINTTNIETGNLTQWANYSREYLMPVNKLLSNSSGTDYQYLRDIMKMNAELISKWSPWSDCDTCGRPQGEGIRTKIASCAIKVTRKNETINRDLQRQEKRLMGLDMLSCRSLLLKHLTPSFYNTSCAIPDFMLSEPCTGVCNPDAAGIYRGWKSTKKTGYKYRKTFVLTENSHLTLVCPESSLDNVVIWNRNAKKLPAGESVPPPSADIEPKITVDTFNTLYLHEVTKEEEGNYTCQVDGIRMQQVVIFVVSKSRLLTQALLRHMLYLAFILSLTLSCYIAGLIVTFVRRRKFKTYRELQILQKNKGLLAAYKVEDESSEKVIKKDSTKQETIQVGSLLIQTCCGVKQKDSDNLLEFCMVRDADRSKRITDGQFERTLRCHQGKRSKKYRDNRWNKNDDKHLLSTDSSEDEEI